MARWLFIQVDPWRFLRSHGKTSPSEPPQVSSSGPRENPVQRSGSDGIRIATLIVVIISASVGVFTKKPQKLPGVALTSVIAFRLELAFLVFLALLLIITSIYNGLVRGILPKSVSSQGLEYPEAEEVARKLKAVEVAKDQIADSTSRRLEADRDELEAELRKRGLI